MNSPRNTFTSVALIYPHQLYESHPALNQTNCFYLIEDPLFFTQYPFHKQKIILHRASMRHYAASLQSQGKTVCYVEASQLHDSSSIASLLNKNGCKQALVMDPCDDWLTKRLTRGCTEQEITLTTLRDPHFFTDTTFSLEGCRREHSYFFTSFYIQQRKQHALLMSNGKPEGGVWSFDKENRKKLPRNHVPVPPWQASCCEYRKEAIEYVEKHYPRNLGTTTANHFPITTQEARHQLQSFINDRLPYFGDVEDAISQRDPFVYHSLLSPALNIGLLSPHEVLAKALAVKDTIPLNCLEGFIRQIIGWREFVRLVYLQKGRRQRTCNYWNHTRKLPSSFYTGTTGIPPIDHVIKHVHHYGYCHHIERLMVLGNFMFLCEFDPDDVYQWFMELFIDAYDWVMVPNIYGMSQHSDGGLMTTKPYISGSAYILKMSDFSKGPWCEVWDGLYWRFISKHKNFFKSNPRMSVMTGMLDKMGDKLLIHQERAEAYLSSL